MAIQIQKKVKVDSQFKMVKLQLLLYTFFKNIDLSDAELNCATHLALKGFKKDFLRAMVEEGVFKSEQTVRNCLRKLLTAKVAIKDGKGWIVNPEISVGIDSLILLDLKVANMS